MTSYNGATFYARIPDGTRPDWEQEPNIVVRHMPYANVDDVQGAGRGNYRLAMSARLDDDSALALLRSAVGTTKRTLTDYYGTNYTGVMLVSVRNPRRLTGQATWFCDLEFQRDGA